MGHTASKRVALAACATAACLPLLACLVAGAGFLDLANEPLAYRYFYPERVLAGDRVAVGVGYSASLLHHAVHAVVQLVPALAEGPLPRRLDEFALLTNGILSTVLAALLVTAARAPNLRTGDLVLLAMGALVPLYATGGWGFEYALLADYTFLDMVLCVAALLLFQLYWRAAGTVPALPEVLALGAFAGFAAANKPTVVVVAAAALVPAAFAAGLPWRACCARLVLAFAAGAATFFAVHLASYLGDAGAAVSALARWGEFVQNPGAEPGFAAAFWASVWRQNYAVLAAFGVAALLLSIAGLEARRSADRRTLLAGTYCMLGLCASVYFVVRRPAHSTLFESAVFVLVLGAMLLTLVEEWPPARKAILAWGAAWAVLALATFPLRESWALVAGSGERARAKWAAFEDARRIAGARPMEVILPDNFDHHEGVFELLFKAASTFPAWETSPGGRAAVLDRYAPGMSLRYTGGAPDPGAPYAGGRVLVWFDRPGVPALTQRVPALAAAVARDGVQQYRWTVLPRGGLVYPAAPGAFTMRAAALP